VDIRVVETPADAAGAAAAWLARSLGAAIRHRGRASVAFSGGRTPAAMLERLATAAIDWTRVEVFQVDERIVPDGDPRRNAALLQVLPAPQANVVLMPVTAPNQHRACAEYARRLPAHVDVVHLGLGDDGHTASWVPGDDALDQPGDVAISAIYQQTRRMTLTRRPINDARRRLMVVTGAAKAEALAGWLLDDHRLPASRLRRAGTVVIADQAAAAALPVPG